MESSGAERHTTKEETLIAVLREIQRSLKGLEDHLVTSSNSALPPGSIQDQDASTQKKLQHDENKISDSEIPHDVHELVPDHPASTPYGSIVDEDTSIKRIQHEAEDGKREPKPSDEVDTQAIEPEYPRITFPRIPKSRFCHVIPINPATVLKGLNELKLKIVSIEKSQDATIALQAAPKEWKVLPKDDSLTNWKYYKPIWKSPRSGSPLGHPERQNSVAGIGIPSIDTKQLLEHHQTPIMFYLPYSHCPSMRHRTSSVVKVPEYRHPWQHFIDPQLTQKYSEKFGGLWEVPNDSRLKLHLLEDQNPYPHNKSLADQLEERAEAFVSLRHTGRLFEITDIDASGSFASYRFGGYMTAATAEIFRLDIGPVGPFLLYPPGYPSKSKSRILDCEWRKPAWRRLIYCEDIPHGFSSPPWQVEGDIGWMRTEKMFQLHCDHDWRTAEEFQQTRDWYIFHVSWTTVDLSNENKSSSPGGYEDKLNTPGWLCDRESFCVVSYTIQPFLPSDQTSERKVSDINQDDMQWTLLILAPFNNHAYVDSMGARAETEAIKTSREGTEVGPTRCYRYSIEIGSLLISTLSAISIALGRAVQDWRYVYKVLEKQLPPRDYYDKMLLNDDNLPSSVVCFWIVDQLQDTMPRLIHAKEEWDQWQQYQISSSDIKGGADKHAKIILEEIEALMQTISEQYQKFDDLQKRAEKIISAIFSLTGVKEARETRLLGENVKLLTYVTIVYLPLSFCSSMWSINGMFGTGIKGFAIITTVLAVTTYAIIATMLSRAIRKASHKLGITVWGGVKTAATWPLQKMRILKEKGRRAKDRDQHFA